MAELAGRMDWEGIVGKEAAKLLRAQMGQILEVLGDPPDISNVPMTFWDDVGLEAQAAMSRHFRDIYVASAEQVLAAQPIGVDWGLINQRAITWADSYSFDLVQGINQTSRDTVARAVSAFFEEGQTIGDLRAALSHTFGPVRAEMIGTTEVTRSAVQGERAFIAELEKMGIAFKKFWVTSQDERVCPICSPLHERPSEEWISEFPTGPPAHPRCRCSEAHEFASAGGRIG